MDRREQRKGKSRRFFACVDISRKRMRQIIMTDNREKQKKMLVKSLHIKFNMYPLEGNQKKKKREDDDKVSIKIHVDNFLPNELNSSASVKKEKDVCEDPEYTYHLYLLKREKMKKIIADYFYNILLFGVTQNLSLSEISTFLSIKKNLLLKLINSRKNAVNLFTEFKRIMLVHSIRRIPFSIKVFAFDSVELCLHYTVHTFFKYFSWYKYIFTPSYEMYFECVDTNIYKSQYESLDIKITDDAWSCSVNDDNIERIKEILNLNVGDLCTFENFEKSSDNIKNELDTYFRIAQLVDDGVMFEMNALKNEAMFEKIVKQIKNTEETKKMYVKEDEKTKELKQLIVNKEKLIKQIEDMYKDVEERIISGVKEILEM